MNAALETGIENPLDTAIVAACEKDGLSIAGFGKIDEIPYDFIRKRLTIVVAEEGEPGEHLIVTKGAFDNVLAVCTKAILPHPEAARSRWTRRCASGSWTTTGKRAREGFRVLAVATRRVPAKAHYGHDDEADMSFAGFILFLDPPKPEARRSSATSPPSASGSRW